MMNSFNLSKRCLNQHLFYPQSSKEKYFLVVITNAAADANDEMMNLRHISAQLKESKREREKLYTTNEKSWNNFSIY